MEEFFAYFLAYKYLVYLVFLTIFVGIEITSYIPSLMYAPLISASLSLQGVVLIGSILILGQANEEDTITLVLSSIAVSLSSVNVVGGFLITDRMLKFYKVSKIKK